MHKFFVNKDQIVDDKIFILGQDVKHIRDVLRLQIEDTIEIASEGLNYLCHIEDILRDKIILGIDKKQRGVNEPPIEITLFQGLAKGNKMDLIIQKGTEIGIKNYYGISTQRTVVKLNKKKKESRMKRWSAIAEEAAKQSKRDHIPTIKGVLSFKDMLEVLKKQKNIIIPYEGEEETGIGSAIKNIGSNKISLVIGPEGGFEDHEIHKLKEIGGKIVSLGPRILRTETAGFLASAIMLYELGDLR